MSRRESGEETAAGDGPRQPTASEEASGGSAAVSSLLVSNGTDPSLPSQSQTSAASAAEHADSFATLLTTPLLPANVLRPDTDTLDARIADTERQLQQARKLAELNRELAALSGGPTRNRPCRDRDRCGNMVRWGKCQINPRRMFDQSATAAGGRDAAGKRQATKDQASKDV